MKISKSLTTLLLSSLLLTTGCVSTTSSFHSKQEQHQMTENTPMTAQMSQREFLNRMLKMMDFAQSIHDFTPENLEKIFDVKLNKRVDKQNGKVRYGFSNRLNKDWWQGFQRYQTVSKEETFLLDFVLDVEANENASLLEICEMDMEEFAQKAERLGFVKQPKFIEHGIQYGVYLIKGKLAVNVTSAYKIINQETREKRPCIQMINVY